MSIYMYLDTKQSWNRFAWYDESVLIWVLN